MKKSKGVLLAASFFVFFLGSLEGKASQQGTISGSIAQVEGQQSQNRQGRDQHTLQEVMAQYNVPGVSIAVIKDFGIHWTKGYGVTDVDTRLPVETGTLFQAGSISKPVTAMAVLKAVQNGQISLDADVNTILKSWKVPQNQITKTRPVTPRALLTHTSGADDGFGFPGYLPSVPTPTIVQVLRGERPSNVGPVNFQHPPFSTYKYSGGGYTIIQLALTDALGMSFEQVMREYALDPLGMGHSTYQQPLQMERQRRAARGHSIQPDSMDVKWRVYPEQAAAGLWTTPTDLAKFVAEVQQALQGPAGRVLSQNMAREMITPVGIGPYSIGFEINKRGEGWYFSHSGGNWGFRCHLVAHVLKGYGVVVMTNSENGIDMIEEIESRVAAVYKWDWLDKSIPR